MRDSLQARVSAPPIAAGAIRFPDISPRPRQSAASARGEREMMNEAARRNNFAVIGAAVSSRRASSWRRFT